MNNGITYVTMDDMECRLFIKSLWIIIIFGIIKLYSNSYDVQNIVILRTNWIK